MKGWKLTIDQGLEGYGAERGVLGMQAEWSVHSACPHLVQAVNRAASDAGGGKSAAASWWFHFTIRVERKEEHYGI